ncbi:MAG: creatininase family protein, partial [Myxococcota bacterium]|nr:creatininase family protein [Myxococcota bacterium]
PHLPLGTDTWIADALAARFCARVPEAVRLPALALGCASEHLSFPGTLSLDEETFRGVLADLVRSLDHHGFAHVFVFSAHGGNLGALRRGASALVAAAGRARVTVFADHAPLTAALFAEAARHGVDAADAGHHAGELETSILAALRPGAPRARALAQGRRWTADDTGPLFYPDLRREAAGGTVGDPRAADPARAEAYLEVWSAALVEAYRGAKKRHATKGTVRP